MWEPKIAQDESVWTEEYAKVVINSHARRPLPHSMQQIGSVEVGWHEPIPGHYHVYALGGTVDDRRLARAIVTGQLDVYGLRPADFTVGGPTLRKTADWNEVQQKAIRLMNDGSVQILRNAPDVVVGHVIGDHGEYQTEISRQNPDSMVIDHWTCECPWDQFAWQRTRQWKNMEGRPCHLPGTRITMADGTQKRIEEVVVGDHVVTHDGIGLVTQTMVRPYNGSSFAIYRSGYPDPIRITENHEVWAVKTPVSIREAAYNLAPHGNQGFKINNDAYVGDEPEWIDAQNLRVHDWVASTWATEECETASLPLATLFGYYLAEGNLAKRSGSDTWGEVQWCLHKDEVELHQEIYDALAALNLKARVYRSGQNAISIRVTSQELADRFHELGGHLASNKKLSSEVMLWTQPLLEAMIKAYANGDGDLKADGRQALNTSSNELARGVYDVLVKCGYIPSWTRQKNNGGPQNRLASGVIHRVSFKWSKRGKANGRRRYENRYLSKVTRIEEEWYEGPVYNLSVDHQESYVAEGVTNHNCAHVLATHWYAQGMPLDQEFDPTTGQPIGQQSAGGQMGLPMALPNAVRPGGPPGPQMPAGGPQMPSQQLSIPGIDPGTATATSPTPPTPGILPLMPIPPMPVPVSVPGAKIPDASNPMQWPGGTFSKVATDWEFGDELSGYKFVWDDLNRVGIIHDVGKQGMTYHYRLSQELDGEDITGGSITPEGIIDIAYGDDRIGAIQWLESQGFRMPVDVEEAAYADQHGYKIAAAGDTFENSDMVRINVDEYGIAEGKSEEHGAGQWRTIKKNSIGEVLGQDQTTGWVDVIFPIHDSGPMEPYHIRAWIEPANLTPMPNVAKPGPFIRRK